MQPTLSKLLLTVLLSLPVFCSARHSAALTENKGQVRNQFYDARPDIQYSMHAGDVSVFIGNGQLHYQWYNSTAPAGYSVERQADQKIEVYRMDVVLLAANTGASVVAEGRTNDYEAYYQPHLSLDGEKVYGYGKVTYKNIYPNIDWVLYADNGRLKYDFIVHPGGKVSDIKMQYNGGQASLGADGAVTATTPFGSITEQHPYSYNAETKQTVASSFVLNNNILSFNVAPYTGSLVIDPVVNWATYYGGNPGFNGSDYEFIPGIETDTAGNVYVAGGTQAATNIATTGAFQSSIAGDWDGFVGKFNAQGVRQWATYYGGTGSEGFRGLGRDLNGNLYAVTYTTGGTNLSTPGAYQTYPNGLLLAKFTSGGSRVWATYYNFADIPDAAPVACDPFGNVYFGHSHGDLVKMTSAGAFVWEKTMSSSGYPGDLVSDASGNTYWAGNGGGQALLRKNDTSGTQIWAVNYGSNISWGKGVALDASGNVYLSGATQSSTGIATPGAHRTTKANTNANAYDGFVAKFNSAGVLQWGSYYGNYPSQWGFSVAVSATGRVFHSGLSGSGAGSGAIRDLYLAEIDPATSALLSTVTRPATPAAGYDYYAQLRYSPIGNLYTSSWTKATTGVATPGAHQTTLSGDDDAVIISFRVDTTVAVAEPFTDTVLCPEETFKLPYTTSFNFKSGNVFTAYLSDASGSFSSPVAIGSLAQVASDTIVCTIPSGTLPGNNYRIRIASTSPVSVSLKNEYAIRIDTTTVPSVTVTASPGVNVGPLTPVTFTATATGGGASPSYQWRKNGVDIAGATAATYTAVTGVDIQSGDDITCRVVSSARCAVVDSASSDVLTMTVNLRIDIVKSSTVGVYPNPNNGDFSLTGAMGYENVEITDISGRIVYRTDITQGAGEMKLDLAGQLANGHYIVRVTSAQATAVFKLTVNK